MRKNFVILSALFALFGCKSVKTKPEATGKPSKSIYDYTVKSIEGEDVSLSKYKGKKILIVNVASECGYTPQYKELQALHEKHGDKLVILGFPANDFLGQEPGTNQEIQSFCTKNFGVTFPMFEKVTVKGDQIAPVYKWLTDKELNGWNTQAPRWNFCKYLIGENGELIAFFASSVTPLSEEITSRL
jgi:glutathione peroxidase